MVFVDWMYRSSLRCKSNRCHLQAFKTSSWQTIHISVEVMVQLPMNKCFDLLLCLLTIGVGRNRMWYNDVLDTSLFGLLETRRTTTPWLFEIMLSKIRYHSMFWALLCPFEQPNVTTLDCKWTAISTTIINFLGITAIMFSLGYFYLSLGPSVDFSNKP